MCNLSSDPIVSTILGSNGHIIYSRHNTSGEGCNCKFNNLFLGVWCVTKFEHFSMHIHLTYNPYQLWALGTYGVWILLAHWITTSNNWYVLVMTEHFSKWLDLVPLLDRNSEGVTCAFLNKILSRFGAPIKVLTNQGTKLCGEFQKLCGKALIDHHMISWNHFEINMLVEWMVYKVKYGLHKGHIQDWDLQLPWLSMGRRFIWQASLSSFSPYLLFGREPKLLA